MYPFLASITATSATSFTEPNRPTGILSGEAPKSLVTMSVSIRAGAMVLAVIPSLTRNESSSQDYLRYPRP